jgi:hypothetical protein
MNVVQEPYVVVEIVKFGLLCGYKIKDTRNGRYLPYEFDDSQKHEAERKCELKNALAYGCPSNN